MGRHRKKSLAQEKSEEIQQEIEKRQKELEEQLIKDYPLFFMEFNQPQREFLYIKNDAGKTPKRRLAEAGNKVGKTEVGIVEDIAHAIGRRIWLKQTNPNRNIDIKVPNHGLIGCETMMHSVPEKIEPTLKRLIPKTCKPVFKLNPQGVVKQVTLTCDEEGRPLGSVIHIRSTDQRPDTFEGIDYDWIHWDEPPPEEHLKAAERGKIVTNSPSWFTMTPLKEAYIYDKFTLKAFNLGGGDQDIAVIRGKIWDNCRDYCYECKLDVPENEETRVIKKCPKCDKLLGFIPKAGINEYLKTLSPDEREAREFGAWHHLSGLVYKELDREKHIYDDFKIPDNWTKIEIVDPHDARATRWLFGAISPEGIEIYGKARNRIYWWGYLLVDGNVEAIARQVKSYRALNGYEEPWRVILDAKFGRKTIKTRTDETSWEEELIKCKIKHIILSHSNPGDIAIGHKIVKEYLKEQYSNLTSVSRPGMVFAKRGCAGDRGPIHDMFNYQWKEGTEKPSEDFKDFSDCVRYGALEQPIYRAPESDKKIANILLDRHLQAVNSRRFAVQL